MPKFIVEWTQPRDFGAAPGRRFEMIDAPELDAAIAQALALARERQDGWKPAEVTVSRHPALFGPGN
jgi:hypothetical protein